MTAVDRAEGAEAVVSDKCPAVDLGLEKGETVWRWPWTGRRAPRRWSPTGSWSSTRLSPFSRVDGGIMIRKVWE